MNKLAQGFNTAAQDSNSGPLSRESEALPLSHGALVVAAAVAVVAHVALFETIFLMVCIADTEFSDVVHGRPRRMYNKPCLYRVITSSVYYSW